MDITHGLLIANKGNLGDQPGATQRLDKVITAATMHTPQDDGWHIFDILPAENTAGHLAEVQRALHANDQEWQGLLARNILFPGTHTSVQLRELQNRDHFIASAEMSEGLHMKNPQLLMTMIAQGHIDPPHKWRMPEDEVFTLLQQMAEDLHGGKE